MQSSFLLYNFTFEMFVRQRESGAVAGCNISETTVYQFINRPVFLLRGWESDLMRFPSLFVLISPLSPRVPSMWPFPSPTQSHVHFLWGQKLVPGPRWLSGSGPVPGLRHAEPPQGPTSWGLQHQRGVGSGGRVEPGLTPLCPLHHNVWIRSHSLTRTFSVICI